MAPEHDARTRAFYDHESDEGAPRRRHAAADWGVNEDIFDRMPSRRFKRADRRAEHREEPEAPRFERRVSGPAAAAPASTRRPARRPAESWAATDDHRPVEDGKRSVDSWLEPEPSKELELVPGESRTIILDAEAEPTAAPEDAGRRTVTITGHPDRLPVPRTQRAPRTAIERIGASPDRIVGYAVLLGFMLVLIAVLTTGQ